MAGSSFSLLPRNARPAMFIPIVLSPGADVKIGTPARYASASSAYPTHTTHTTLSLLSQTATFSSTQAILPSLLQITSSTTPSPGSTPAHTPTNFLLQVTTTSRSFHPRRVPVYRQVCHTLRIHLSS